jgi:hypothetical protein
LATTTVAESGQQLATGLVNSSLAGVSNTTTTSVATNSAGFPEIATFTADSDFSVAFWIIPQTTTSTQVVYGQIANFLWAVNFTSDKFTFQVETASGVVPNFWSWTTTTQPINQSEPVHFAAVFSQATKTAAIYVNGTNVTGTRSTASPITLQSNGDVVSIFQGPIQQIVLWTSAITQTVIQEIIKFSSANFYESTSARVSRIIAQTPFPASLVTASGTQNILDLTDDAPFAGPELQITAQTEGAVLYVNRSGQIIQQSLYGQFTTTNAFTSQTTYGSTGTALQPEVSIAYDASSYRNALNVSMSQGGVVKTTGAVPSTIYGEATQDWPTYAPTYAQSKLIGNVLVGFGQYIYPAFQDFEVVLSGANDWSATLGLDLIERITVKVQPPTGNLITQDLQLSSIQHRVVPGQWITTLNGSARWASSFRLDRSSINGTDTIVYA